MNAELKIKEIFADVLFYSDVEQKKQWRGTCEGAL
jgi:hypothetical protein